MKALTKTLKTMLDALAHEHAGEYLTPGQKTAVLNQATKDKPIERVAPTVQEPVPVSRRRVALFMGSELPADVMEYVNETCIRLQHDLTVVTFESETTANALLAPHRDQLATAGINVELVTLGGNTLSQLARYLDNHPEIAFLACKESGYLGRSYLTGNQKKLGIPVPVVVIVERKDGAVQPKVDGGEVPAGTKIA